MMNPTMHPATEPAVTVPGPTLVIGCALIVLIPLLASLF
jgi:hypothetical protein